MCESNVIPDIRVYAPSEQVNSERNPDYNEDCFKEERSHSVDNTFQMRTINLTNFPNNSSSNRTNYRTVINRARIGITTSTAKSLNVLRQALQNRINSEINEILQKYLQNYFQPAAENIKRNFGVNAISEQHLQAVCRQVLEEAKNMYFGPLLGRCASPVGGTVKESNDHPSDSENVYANHVYRKRNRRDRRDSDSNSESGSCRNTLLKPSAVKKKRLKTIAPAGRGRGAAVKNHGKSSADSIRRDGPKWDPNRLTTQTKFVLGSKANKALGFGSTRGRLYTKHAVLFRYIGDQEDKQWLHEHGLMPLAGGRAYLLIKEDIENLIDSDEYKNAPGVNRSDMGDGFTVPEAMILKMKAIMSAMKDSEPSSKKKPDNNRAKANATTTSSSTPLHDASSIGSSSNQPSVDNSRPDSRGVSPADDLDCVNSSGMPSTNPSPYSITGAGLSPNEENQEISPIASDYSASGTLNEIHL